VIVVYGQKVALGRTYAGQTVTVAVSDTILAMKLDDQVNPRGAQHHHVSP
jgi:hypothetical protein